MSSNDTATAVKDRIAVDFAGDRPTWSEQAEKELVAKAQADQQAFLDIYELYFKRIYNYAYYRTLNQVAAEEITSTTFLKALENIKRYEYRKIPLAVWLYKIASNTLTDYYRRENRSGGSARENSDTQAALQTPETLAVHKSEREQLLQELNALPAQQQQAVVLRYRQELSIKEIAGIMDKTEGAVKQMLHRGLTALREGMVRYEQ